MTTIAMRTLDRLTVDVPEGERDGMRVERFTIGESDWKLARMQIRGRGTKPGSYTKLTCGGTFWMSDTDAEKRDHFEAVQMMGSLHAERVLINGLGLGMVLAAALSFDHVQHVDVVERDARVIALVGPTYLADSRVAIHQADAYEQTQAWPTGTRWDVGWSDIWPDLCTDNLSSYARLNRSYGRRTRWHGCWGEGILRRQREVERRESSRWRY